MIREAAFELTLACNARCRHCGSSALHPRKDELTTKEAIHVIRQLGDIGCDTLTFSGGEPLMRADWPLLAQEVHACGLSLGLITNGLLVAEQADTITKSEFKSVGVSIDGPPDIHDALRGVPGGFTLIMAGLNRIQAAGVRVGVVTQINRLNRPHLPQLLSILESIGPSVWQLQLTMPHGRAGKNWKDLAIPVTDLPHLEREVAELIRRSKINIICADNFGYFGRFEPLFRHGLTQKPTVWSGCRAGLDVIGICADGGVKGCLSMPDTMIEGNLRKIPLEEMWRSPRHFRYNRHPEQFPLTGHCATCALGRHCRAGCTSAAMAANGLVTENPMCIRHQLNEVSTENRSIENGHPFSV